ncbi:MAG TPA: hypothetical protein VN048_05335 [Verrucomicrobiae bacterium]|jgi:hypothetical protein|nr:hypothetical protein [Verrucomicrobiae bacterium]
MKDAIAAIFAAGLMAAGASGETVTFDTTPTGTIPKGWLAGVTGGGAPNWQVVTNNSASGKPHVLKQGAEFAGRIFPWCVKRDAVLKDGFVQVKFKPVSGKEDMAGGLIWRWQDGDNYYVARANAAEDNVTIYHTFKGTRTEFKRTAMKVAPNQWHSLRVDFKGSHFIVTYDGQKAIEWDDDTFPNAGSVGVWTKADSVTLFDEFTFEGN